MVIVCCRSQARGGDRTDPFSAEPSRRQDGDRQGSTSLQQVGKRTGATQESSLHLEASTSLECAARVQPSIPHWANTHHTRLTLAPDV